MYTNYPLPLLQFQFYLGLDNVLFSEIFPANKTLIKLYYSIIDKWNHQTIKQLSSITIISSVSHNML
jgi:hypothetical protein